MAKKINLPVLARGAAKNDSNRKSESERPKRTDRPEAKKSDRPEAKTRSRKSDKPTRRSSRPPKKPTLEDARNRLGGRTIDEDAPPVGMRPGSIVRVVALGGSKHPAVVVFANSSEVHVLIDGTKLRRVRPAQVDSFSGEAPALLAKISADAQVFGGLSEGLPVRYADDVGGLLAGRLLEKCRYGALVVRDDGAVVAVGFRKLWPAATAAGAA